MALDWAERPDTPELSDPNNVIFFLLPCPGWTAGHMLSSIFMFA